MDGLCNLAEHAAGKLLRVLVVSDGGSGEAGKKALDLLTAGGYRCKSYVYETRATASAQSANLIKGHMTEDTKLIVGVGGGIISDIVSFNGTKYKLPTIMAGTSPSCAGYLSTGANLRSSRLPETFIVRPHSAVLFDLDYALNAPPAFFAAGFGSLISTALSLFDWSVSAVMRGEEYCGQVSGAAAALIERTTELSEGLLKGDKNASCALCENLLKLSALSQAVGTTRLQNSSPHQCSTALSILRERRGLSCRLHGEGTFLFSKLLARVYRRFLENAEIHSLPPPDNVSRLEKINKVFGINETAVASRLCPVPSSEIYELISHKLTEYRLDLLESIIKIDELFERSTKIFSRIYSDAGFWIKRYSTEDDFRLILALTPDLTQKYTFLSFLKDIGYLEQFL
jgi:glycerol dehydrogenase-like iron-containing ADH family enzyme